MFANAGRAEWYIGSADLMERNLDRRVEVVTPVEDIEAQARLARIVDVMLADNRRSWQLGPDGAWRRTEAIESVEGTIDTFATLKDDAAMSVVGRTILTTPASGPPVRWIRARDGADGAEADGGRAQVPDDRRRDRRAAAGRRRPGGLRGDRRRSRPCDTRIAISTPPMAPSKRPATRAACGRRARARS